MFLKTIQFNNISSIIIKKLVNIYGKSVPISLQIKEKCYTFYSFIAPPTLIIRFTSTELTIKSQ